MSDRILIVEDQEDLRAILRDLFSSTGFEVVEAADGGQGVAKAKAEATTARTPVIAISSFAMKGDEEKARAAGCDAYVTKPYSPLKLLGLVKTFLERK